MRIHVPHEPIPLAIFVSGHGRGSNMKALIAGCADDSMNAVVAVVVGTRSDAPAILTARGMGIDTVIISPKKYEADDEGYGQAILKALNRRSVRLICLAGYMRQLPANVVKHFNYRILNTHPALLPKFGGKGMFGEHVHRAVLASGDAITGCSVHFVDEEYDTGPTLLQRTVPVIEGDTPSTLAARVLKEEHIAYPEAVRLYSNNRVRIENGIVIILPEFSQEKTDN